MNISVAFFSQLHQGVYRSNIQFVKGRTKEGKARPIRYLLKTGFGEFIGKGTTRNEAKLDAVQLAYDSMDLTGLSCPHCGQALEYEAESNM